MENPACRAPAPDQIAVILAGLYWEVWVDLDELVQIAMTVWNELPQAEKGLLIDSVKARLQAVMNAHGEAAKY